MLTLLGWQEYALMASQTQAQRSHECYTDSTTKEQPRKNPHAAHVRAKSRSWAEDSRTQCGSAERASHTHRVDNQEPLHRRLCPYVAEQVLLRLSAGYPGHAEYLVSSKSQSSLLRP